MTILATAPGANGMPPKAVQTLRGFVTRTDTTAKQLFTLPKNARVLFFSIWGFAASNAGTTATLSLGKQGGTGSEFLSGYDVKTAASGNGLTIPNAQLLEGYNTANPNVDTAKTTVDVTVTGTYAETGAASSSGGPWTVEVYFVTGEVMEG